MRRAAALGLALVALGCSTPPARDAGPSDAGPVSLALGTGEQAFAPVAEGETLLLARGCQGLQHVWIALRATGLAPRGVHVHLSLARDDGTEVSAPFDTAITFTPDARSAAEDLSGLMLVVPTPDDALGLPLTLRAEVTDREGRSAAAAAPVTLAWGTDVCG